MLCSWNFRTRERPRSMVVLWSWSCSGPVTPGANFRESTVQHASRALSSLLNGYCIDTRLQWRRVCREAQIRFVPGSWEQETGGGGGIPRICRWILLLRMLSIVAKVFAVFFKSTLHKWVVDGRKLWWFDFSQQLYFSLWAHADVCSIFSIQLIELVIIINVDWCLGF